MNKSGKFIKNISEIPEYARHFLDGKLYTEDGCCFEINKIMLARKSLYFEMLFCGFFCNKTEFLIPGISKECLHEILRYLHTGKISLNSENVIEIIMAANYLIMTDLITVVRENVKQTLTIDNSLQLLMLSDLLNDKVIHQESFRYTQLHFQEIMTTQTDDFTNLSLGILKNLLSAKNLSIDTEISLWLAIEMWTEKKKSEKKRHVPLLLTCLALEDLDENSATEIMEHDLIVNNSHVKKLSPSDYPSNHDLLKSTVLKNNKHLIQDIFKSRIPTEIHIIGMIEDNNSYQLYATYDENLDVWRKIVDINVQDLTEPFILYNIQNYLYIFEFSGNWKIDLSTGVLEQFHVNFTSITPLKNKLYFLDTVYTIPDEGGELETACKFEMYDCNTNSWTEDEQIFNMDYGQCVSIDECIYVVGRLENAGVMTAYVYNTTPFDFEAIPFPQSRVKKLPSPAVFRCSDFQVVVYRHKIFVLGGRTDEWKNLRSVEAFDVESHTWNQLEDLPFSYWSLYEMHAVVLNDRLFVYEFSYETSSKIAVWNDDLEKWVRLQVKDDLVTTPKWDLEGFEMPISSIRKIRRQKNNSRLYHNFCTISDKDAISALCSANRRLPFVRSRFSEKDTFQQDWFVKK